MSAIHETAALDSTVDSCYNISNYLQEMNGVAHVELEKIATNAVETSIAKTDRLTSFISRGDKEPCWDGNIYIHESKNHTKKNIKKVSTQIKGKSAILCEAKETIKYRISRDDLTAYMMNGGTMFFVVYIDSKTGDALQIYYTDLLPLKIRDLIKNNQNSYQVIFHKFPDDNSEKTVLLLNFYDDAQRQASFAGKELPTIDDLEKIGILESLSFHCRGYGNYQTRRAIPKLMDGKSLSMYANIKGGSAPIPIEYFESIHRVIMSERRDMPVFVNGIQYYDGYQVITTAEKTELYIGSSVKIALSNSEETNAPSPMIITVKIRGTLKERIVGLEFVSAMMRHKKLNIGDLEIPLKLSETDIKKLGVADFSKRLAEYNQVQALLNSMNVKKDLDIHKCNDEDFRRLNLLIGAIRDKLPVKNAPDRPGNVQKITIANLTLAVVYIEHPNIGYFIFDYFGNHFDVSWSPDDSKPTEVSQFFTMGADDFLSLDNLNLEMVVEDFKQVKISSLHLDLGNHTMLTMLKAYDKQPSVELLNAAQQLCEWQQKYPEFIPADITTINRLQIALRKRALTFQEKSELYAIISSTTGDFLKVGAFLLLDEQDEAKNLLNTLPEEELRKFEDFPICRFLK